ncbi:MAG: hypothetical protein GWO81_02085 [Verrucomicrobia bacterium]|nr:hypothetical protein [Verrucomicrobiota bacterium]
MKQNLTILLAAGCLAANALLAQSGYVASGEQVRTLSPEQRTVAPLTSPYYHEDSFITSDLRAWYLSHQLDRIGGEVTVAALQVRVALTEQLQLVAYKDGYTKFSDGSLDGKDGCNDVGIGIKYALVQDWANEYHIAVGVGYEFDWGNSEALQNTDELRLWISENKSFGKLHLGATLNYLIAVNKNQGELGSSDMLTLHFHSDYYLTEWLSPVFEINGYFVTDDNGTGVAPYSGMDAGSLGSGQDEDVWTAALGAEVRPFDNNDVSVRAAYETDVSDSSNLFDYRWTFSAVYPF